MQKGLAFVLPNPIIGAVANPSESDIRQVWIFNTSGVNLYIADDRESANANNGVPILPGTDRTLVNWLGELWIGADVDNSEYRYILSKHQAVASMTWEQLRKQTPAPPKYYNRPI